jgi:DNA-directed RNA polymerase specialized sigma24 family protein
MPRRSVVEGAHASRFAPVAVVLDLGPVGPRSELERTYRRSHRRLTGVATVLLGTTRGAEGLVHDAFARVLASDTPVPDDEAVAAVIVQLVLLSRARDRRSGMVPGVPRSPSRAARRCRGPAADSVDAALLDQVQGLASSEREALALCAVGSMSCAEAAGAVGSTPSRVESDRARAVRVLMRPLVASPTGSGTPTALERIRRLAGSADGRGEPGPEGWERVVAGAERLRHQRWRATVGTAGAAAAVAVILVGSGLGAPDATRPSTPPSTEAPLDGTGRSPAVVLDDEVAARVAITVAFGAFDHRDDTGYRNLAGGEDVGSYEPLLASADAAFGDVGRMVLHVHEITFLSGWQAQVDALVHVPTSTGVAEVPLRAYAARIADRWVVTEHTVRQVVGLVLDAAT